jgi:hypothetical protein
MVMEKLGSYLMHSVLCVQKEHGHRHLVLLINVRDNVAQENGPTKMVLHQMTAAKADAVLENMVVKKLGLRQMQSVQSVHMECGRH